MHMEKQKWRKLKVQIRGESPLMSIAKEGARTMQEQGRGDVVSDVLGSYTGTPVDGEVPEQDADDL